MAGLPAFILIGFSALIWILRDRHIRIIWILTLSSFFLAWLTTFLLLRFLPVEFVISRWDVVGLSESRLAIELSTNSIALANLLLMLGLVITLSLEGREEKVEFIDLFSLCFSGGVGLIVILSGNFITFAMTWIVWEIVLYLRRIHSDGSDIYDQWQRSSTLRRLISVPIAILVGVMLYSYSDKSAVSMETAFTWAFLLGVITVVTRIQSVQSLSKRSKEGESITVGEIWMIGISISSGFAFLDRIVGIHRTSSEVTISLGIGVLITLIGIGRLAFRSENGSSISL